jgi:hypothetical protein
VNKKEWKRERPTMFKARVVFPAMAILIPPTQAHDRADPVNWVFAFKTGPPPPAFFTDQPRKAKAAMIAAIDLMKNNHLIFLGWIRTTPKDKEGNHFTGGDTDMSGDVVG